MIRIVLVLLNIVLCIVTAKIVIDDGYYWKDYRHKIPGDAVVCGKDSSGDPIYVGQALYDIYLVSGKIYSNNSDVYFALFNSPNRSDRNLKILCSLFPQKFEWIWASTSDISNLTNKVPVEGGYQPDHLSYIGRLYVGEETTCGKFMCRTEDCPGFYYVMDGNRYDYKGSVEVLTYNFDKD